MFILPSPIELLVMAFVPSEGYDIQIKSNPNFVCRPFRLDINLNVKNKWIEFYHNYIVKLKCIKDSMPLGPRLLCTVAEKFSRKTGQSGFVFPNDIGWESSIKNKFFDDPACPFHIETSSKLYVYENGNNEKGNIFFSAFHFISFSLSLFRFIHTFEFQFWR